MYYFAKYLINEFSIIDKGLNWAYTKVFSLLIWKFSFFLRTVTTSFIKSLFLPQYISIHWWHSISHSQLYNNILANDIGFQYPKENLILSQVFLPFQFIWQDFCFNYCEIRWNSTETKKKQNISLLFYNYKSFQKKIYFVSFTSIFHSHWTMPPSQIWICFHIRKYVIKNKTSWLLNQLLIFDIGSNSDD